jgi:hypothetical protein
MQVFAIMKGYSQAHPIPYSEGPVLVPEIRKTLLQSLITVSPGWPKNIRNADRFEISFGKNKWDNPTQTRADQPDVYPDEYEYICNTIKQHLNSTVGEYFCENEFGLFIRMCHYEKGSKGQKYHEDYTRPGCIPLFVILNLIACA